MSINFTHRGLLEHNAAASSIARETQERFHLIHYA